MSNFPIIKGGFEEAFLIKREIYLPINISDTIKFIYASEIMDVNTINFDNLFGSNNLIDEAVAINADAILNFSIDANLKLINNDDHVLLVSGTPVKKCDIYLDTLFDIADPKSSFKSYTPDFMVVKGGSLELFLRTRCLYLPIDTGINHNLVSASEKMELDLNGRNRGAYIIRTDNLINTAKSVYAADAIAHFSIDATLQLIDNSTGLFKVYFSGIPMKIIDADSFDPAPYMNILTKYLSPDEDDIDDDEDIWGNIFDGINGVDNLKKLQKKPFRHPRAITQE